MANGKSADFDIPFEKKFFSKKNKECRGKIREILDREHFDLIILNTTLAAFHIRLAARRKARPRIVNIAHGFLFSEHQRGLRAKVKALILLIAEKILRGKTDAILTMNDEDHRIATRQNLVHGPIIPTFGMGVPDPRFNLKPGEIRKKYAKDSDYVILFAGELSKRKNQRFLIDAMPDLIAKIPEAKLWLDAAVKAAKAGAPLKAEDFAADFEKIRAVYFKTPFAKMERKSKPLAEIAVQAKEIIDELK
jgi:glycosyltransferase involved in cell wall biosynthesis